MLRREDIAFQCIGALFLLWTVLGAVVTGAEPAIENDSITLSVENMEITELLKLLAARHQINIVASREVSGQVSVNLFNLPLETALRAVLQINGFAFERRNGILFVFKAPDPVGSDTSTHLIRLKYAKAADVERVVKPLLSPNGKISAGPTQNTLLVTDEPHVAASLESIIAELDAHPRQVMIDARLVEVGDTLNSAKGINWSSLEGLKVGEITAEKTYQRDKSNTELAKGPDVHALRRTINSLISLRGGVLAENEFTLVLNFFETCTDSRIVSQPRVMTIDGHEASIIIGTIVPIPLFDFATDTGVRTLSGFQDERIGIELKVTPYVNDDGLITLQINPKVEDITDFITVDGDRQRPIRSTRQATTTVMIKHGQTVVIGGLLSEGEHESIARVPVLGKVPLLGHLFRNRVKSRKTTDLMIFITPRIVNGNTPLTQREQDAFNGSEPPTER